MGRTGISGRPLVGVQAVIFAQWTNLGVSVIQAGQRLPLEPDGFLWLGMVCVQFFTELSFIMKQYQTATKTTCFQKV